MSSFIGKSVFFGKFRKDKIIVSSAQIADFGLQKEHKKKKDGPKKETLESLSIKISWLFETLKKTYKKSLAQKECINELQNLLTEDNKVISKPIVNGTKTIDSDDLGEMSEGEINDA